MLLGKVLEDGSVQEIDTQVMIGEYGILDLTIEPKIMKELIRIQQEYTQIF
jgi:hypothetical protein